jgi:hypothetical protein
MKAKSTKLGDLHIWEGELSSHRAGCIAANGQGFAMWRQSVLMSPGKLFNS